MNPRIQAVASSFAAWVRERFGQRVREITLFGSVARGEAHEESDIDIAVVVDELTYQEGREVAHQAGDYLTQHDVLISPFVVSTAHMQGLRYRERLIANEIARDGVQL